jgi:hypothetical protein
LPLTNAAFGRNQTLECGDLSPLWIPRHLFTTEKESGDKSPHSKMIASGQEIAN